MQKALSLFEKGPLALVAGAGLNPRPLGYEPYDARLCRLRQSPVILLTSVGLGRDFGLRPNTSPLSQPVPPRLVYKSVYKTGSQLAALHPGTAEDVIAVPTAPSQRIPAANAT